MLFLVFLNMVSVGLGVCVGLAALSMSDFILASDSVCSLSSGEASYNEMLGWYDGGGVGGMEFVKCCLDVCCCIWVCDFDDED